MNVPYCEFKCFAATFPGDVNKRGNISAFVSCRGCSIYEVYIPPSFETQTEYSTEAPKQKTPNFALQDMDTTSNLAALIRRGEEETQ